MALSDELQRLTELHESGALSDEEFRETKALLLAAGWGQVEGRGSMPKGRLRRSLNDRRLCGVCGGLARYTRIESWIWRLGFVFLLLFWGTGLLLYILLWIFVPEE